MKTLGQIAYEAYCAETGWKSLVSGAVLSIWDNVDPKIKVAWEAVGEQVRLRQHETTPTQRVTVDTVSVRVMRSADYCHFEVVLGIDRTQSALPQLSLADVDSLRKEAARLADKAVEQYKKKKKALYDCEQAEYVVQAHREEAEAIEKIAETDRTPEQQATLKAYLDACFELSHQYDYQDEP